MNIFRPTLSQENIEDVNKLLKLVEWFLTHDEGTKRRYWNSRHILKTLLIAGFVPKENFESDGISSFTKNTDCYTLQEFVTESIMKKIRFLKTKGGGKIRKEDFKELLDGLYRTIDSYVTSANQLGDDTLNEFNNNFYRAGFYPDSPSIEELKLYLPKEKVHETIREIVENQLLDSRESQLVATLWVSKLFLEVVACILCWIYLKWFKELYVDPYSANEFSRKTVISDLCAFTTAPKKHLKRKSERIPIIRNNVAKSDKEFMTTPNSVTPEGDNQQIKRPVSALENSLYSSISYVVRSSAVIIGFYFIIDTIKYAWEIYSSTFSQLVQLSDSKFIPTTVTATSVIITFPLLITACRIFLYPLAIFRRHDLGIKSVLVFDSLIIFSGIAVAQSLFPFFNMLIFIVASKLFSL